MSIDLDKYCIVRPYEEAWLPPYGKFHQAGPGRLIKRYPTTKRPMRICTGAILKPTQEIKPLEEIRKLVDKRPLSELRRQADDRIKQLLYRAHCGDHQALSEYVRITSAAVRSL